MISNRLNKASERITELENRPYEVIQNAAYREKEIQKI